MGWRAAERREQTLRALEGPLSPTAALDAAFELHQLFADSVHDSDIIRTREIAEARAAWGQVRERLACRRGAPTPR